jgi:UDP-N-acetylglucosamine 2-epimerase
MSVVGARPQFIKLAPMHAALSRKGRHIIVHTGQHYDDAMSAQFFRELGLPDPDINLGIKGGSHATPTGRMLIELAKVIQAAGPGWLLVYGDTTSTLAGALAGVQCGVRTAHVEAGLRSFVKTQPEERNRVVADHVSDLLLCPTATAVRNLRREGIRSGVHLVGDPMQEALAWHWQSARTRRLSIRDDDFLFCTVHRAENTDSKRRLQKLLRLLERTDRTVVFPVHPRTRNSLKEHSLWRKLSAIRHVHVFEPFGYLDTLRHIAEARAVLTDSGGVQREAAWLGTLCLTLRPVTEWVETVREGQNVLVDLDITQVRAALARKPRRKRLVSAPLVAQRIARLLE